MQVPFKKTYYDEQEKTFVCDALSGADYTGKVKAELGSIYENSALFLTSSASAALDLLFAAMSLEQGGEVIMPSFTYPSAANTVLRYGLVPVFAEIDFDTKALDLNDVERRMTKKTGCVLPTHYGGSSVDMDRLKQLCGSIAVAEDASLSFGAVYKGRPLGSIGDYGVVSFHRTKNVSAEQGGLLLLNGAAKEKQDAVQLVYDNGTDRQKFLNGETEAYTWQVAGMNAGMSNLHAAVLYSQLKKADEIKRAQKKIYDYYMQRLSDIEGLGLPALSEYNSDNCHVYYIMLQSKAKRESVRKALEAKGIAAYFHYMPLHASGMGQKLGYRAQDLPVTMAVSERILRLPIYAGMTPEQTEYTADSVLEAVLK